MNTSNRLPNILIRTPEPARRSLTLANTRSPKSLSSHSNERSSLATTSTIHECDEGILPNNSDDEDEDRLSTAIDESNNYATISNETKSLERFTDSVVYKDFLRQGLITTNFSSSRSTIRTTTTTSIQSTISASPLAVSTSTSNENGSTSNNVTNGNNGTSNTLAMLQNNLSTDESFRISHINRNFSFCRSYPLVLVLPKDILDESLKKVARCHKLQR